MIDDLDPNSRGRILSLIDEKLALPRIGRVTKVWTHSSTDDVSNHEVNVVIPPGGCPEIEHRRVPILQPTAGTALVPQKGDMVRVSYLDGDGNRPVVDGVVYGDQSDDRAPLGAEGDVRVSRGELYAEIAGDGSYVRLAQKSADDADPDLVVELDSNGVVRLGDPSGELLPVARRGDAVEVDHPDYGTLSGQIIEGSSEVESS